MVIMTADKSISQRLETGKEERRGCREVGYGEGDVRDRHVVL